MKATEVALSRMKNSGLMGSGFNDPVDIVKAHGAMQAQDYEPAKWSLSQRTSAGLSSGDVDELLAAGAIIRTHVMRPTWHFVAAEDLLWLLRLTGPRIQRSLAKRYRDLGLDPKTKMKAEKLVEEALSGGYSLTRKELAEVLEQHGLSTEGQRLPHLLMHCELEGMICSGGISGKQHTYALIVERGLPRDHRLDKRESINRLVRRYLGSHGPATLKDLSWWSGFTLTAMRDAIHDLGNEVRSESIDGLIFWMEASAEPRGKRSRSANLLPTYDEVIVGYTAESRYFADPRAAEARASFMGRGASPHDLVILDSKIGGHWRRTLRAKDVVIDVRLYEKPRPSITRALEKAAVELGRFLALEPHLQVTLL